jgi:hypothetical protein
LDDARALQTVPARPVEQPSIWGIVVHGLGDWYLFVLIPVGIAAIPLLPFLVAVQLPLLAGLGIVGTSVMVGRTLLSIRQLLLAQEAAHAAVNRELSDYWRALDGTPIFPPLKEEGERKGS